MVPSWTMVWCRAQSRQRFSRFGVAAEEPVDHMVGVAVAGTGLAAGDDASLVPDVEGPADLPGYHPGGAPHIEGHPVGSEDQPGHPGVTEDPPCRLGTEQPTVLGHTTGTTDQTQEGLVRGGHRHLRAEAPRDRCLP